MIGKRGPQCLIGQTTEEQAYSWWNDETKKEATDEVQQTIDQLQVKISDIDKLLRHTQSLAVARSQYSKNVTGNTIYAKLISKYEAQLTKALRSIEQLYELIVEVRYSVAPMDVEIRIQDIVAVNLQTSRSHSLNMIVNTSQNDFLGNAFVRIASSPTVQQQKRWDIDVNEM